MQLPDAFTKKFKESGDSIITNVGVTQPFDLDNIGQPPKPHLTSAMWDTGSSDGCITASLANNLDLHPIRKTIVSHHEGHSPTDVYLVALFITGRYYVIVELAETRAMSSDFEIIIGRDIICQGDFALTNVGGKCTFSFRLPSIETLDFRDSD